MANDSTKTEICNFLDQTYDDQDLNELSKIDISLLMSLLEDDSQLEDEEMFVIQSLPNQDSCSETYVSEDDLYNFSAIDQLESSCSSSPSSSSPDHDHLSFEWIDDMEMASVEHFEGFEDYSQVCYGMDMPMEEDYYNIGLWQ